MQTCGHGFFKNLAHVLTLDKNDNFRRSIVHLVFELPPAVSLYLLFPPFCYLTGFYAPKQCRRL